MNALGPRPGGRDGGNILVLGGGGARGFAHLGVIRVLEDAGIRIDRIVGVSIGAFIGGVYCQNPDVRDVTGRIREYITSDRFRKTLDRLTKASSSRAAPRAPETDVVWREDAAPAAPPTPNGSGWLGRIRDYLKATVAFHRFVLRQSILTHKPLEDCLEAIADNVPIEELRIPLTIVAADLCRGSRVHIESGDLFSAILGSTALPGIFPPVPREGCLLADYGVLCSIPVSTALSYRPEKIIAVDLTPELAYRESFASGLEIVNRMEDIGCYLFKEHIAAYADVLIKPDVGRVDWADFQDLDRVVEQGVLATESVLPTLLKVRSGTP